jgi:hypothetical protein
LITQEIHRWDPSLPLLFLIDWGSLKRDCHRLQLVMEKIQQEYQNENDDHDHDKKISLLQHQPYTLLVDFTGSTRQTQCDFLFQESYYQDKTRIRLAKRSIVQGRYYNHHTKKLHLGQILSPLGWHPHNMEIPILHSPLFLRESFVNTILATTSGVAPVNNKKIKRTTDVGFFWNNGDYSHYAFYRRDIAKIIKTLHHSKISNNVVMENEVALAYTDIKEYDAGNVQLQYISKLLNCKIVVVTQRDEWEDQYRLMESLASGAMVMTDNMLAMPAGLVDKVNIIVYDSPQALKQLIRYYIHPNHRQERQRVAKSAYERASIVRILPSR